MKLSRNTFWFAVFFSLISIVISWTIFYYTDIIDINIYENFLDNENISKFLVFLDNEKIKNILKFFMNIFLNIFAGTIVLTITSWFNYHIEKQKLIDELTFESMNIYTLFLKLKYWDENEDHIFYEKNNFKGFSKDEYFENIKEKNKKYITILANNYLNAIDYNYDNFRCLYKEAHFLFDFKSKKANTIHDYTKAICNIIDQLTIYRDFFELCTYGMITDYDIIENNIKTIQKIIFPNGKSYFNDVTIKALGVREMIYLIRNSK